MDGPEFGQYVVRFPFLAKSTWLPASCIAPVYNDCEECGYAAWTAVEKTDGWHHYCAWHHPEDRYGV